jgi:coenzyme F420-0:L-glutamate ligase/coenzyme F420-1:gamma-L-glutamate ligase
VIASISTRRSIRRYLDAPVEEQLLHELLAAALAAPSSHHRQPWRFALLRGAAARARLAEAMAQRLRADRRADGDAPEAIERDARRSVERICTAPVALLACLTLAEMDRYPDARRAQAEALTAVQSVALACANVLLAAHARGLGACWMCGPLFCPDTVREALELPADWRPQALLTLGWPAEAGRARPRKPLAEVLRVID